MRIPKQAVSGLLFIAIGGIAAATSLNYRLGTPMRMGPGFFPVAVGVITALLGAFLVLRGLRTAEADEKITLALPPLRVLRAASFILLAVVLFALLIRPAGLVASTVAVVALSSLAKAGGSLRETLALSIVLPAIAVAIFIVGLNMPLNLWPS